MDVEQLRKDCKTAKILHGPISAAGMTADALLRILDAFEVMKICRWRLSWDRIDGVWEVMLDGRVFAQGTTPLEAMLSAADKMKGTNDVNA